MGLGDMAAPGSFLGLSTPFAQAMPWASPSRVFFARSSWFFRRDPSSDQKGFVQSWLSAWQDPEGSAAGRRPHPMHLALAHSPHPQGLEVWAPVKEAPQSGGIGLHLMSFLLIFGHFATWSIYCVVLFQFTF